MYFTYSQVRVALIGLVIAASARGTAFLAPEAAAFVHLISFSINFGMIAWVSSSMLHICLAALLFCRLCLHEHGAQYPVDKDPWPHLLVTSTF